MAQAFAEILIPMMKGTDCEYRISHFSLCQFNFLLTDLLLLLGFFRLSQSSFSRVLARLNSTIGMYKVERENKSAEYLARRDARAVEGSVELICSTLL